MIGKSAIAAAAATVAVAGVANAQLDAELVVGGLERPVFLTHAPGDTSRLFVLEKRGRIRIIEDGVLLATPFLNIDNIIGGGTSDNNEQGLLGLAFHPDYDDNGYFYVNFTANTDAQQQEDTILARFSVDPNDPYIADPNSMLQLLRLDQPFSNHNAGWIAFGPNDDYLYMTTGDGGSANDPGNRAQTITNQLLGKVLRFDVDGDDFPADPDKNYAIPPSNPFVDATGDDEIWAYGLRNPWRASFDRATGDLYIGDVGQDSREEVNYQPGDSAGAENYGWRCMEGIACTGLTGCTCNAPELTLPIYDYSHFGGAFKCAVTGGYVYRGCAMTELQGTYFATDYCSDEIWTFKVVDGKMTEFADVTDQLTPDVGDVDNIASFGEDYFGEIYIVDQVDGHIFKIVSADGTDDCPGLKCAADCNADADLNILDFVCFQDKFTMADPAADCNEDGDLNILDFVCYQGLFQQGCP
jgi:glucose/arabinose dehydrogenase